MTDFLPLPQICECACMYACAKEAMEHSQIRVMGVGACSLLLCLLLLCQVIGLLEEEMRRYRPTKNYLEAYPLQMRSFEVSNIVVHKSSSSSWLT